MGTRIQDPIPEWATHLAVIHKDGTVETGPKDDLLPAVSPHQKSPSHTGHQPITDHQLDKVLKSGALYASCVSPKAFFHRPCPQYLKLLRDARLI